MKSLMRRLTIGFGTNLWKTGTCDDRICVAERAIVSSSTKFSPALVHHSYSGPYQERNSVLAEKAPAVRSISAAAICSFRAILSHWSTAEATSSRIFLAES